MPEGDTIHRTAERLRAALVGRPLTGWQAARLAARPPAAGTRVEGVEARGKHLLVHLSDGRTLHTHMRMDGSWHLYRTGTPWRKARTAARVVLETDEWTAVCFSAPVVELLPTPEVRRHPALRRLGPDLSEAGVDLEEAAARLAGLPGDTPVAVALLDQSVASGIGNVFRSEVLFACRTDPFATVRRLDAEQLRGLMRTASAQLRANVKGGRRRTYGDGLAVYGRAGRPCPRCGTPIRSARVGAQARTVYWCPGCQPPGDAR